MKKKIHLAGAILLILASCTINPKPERFALVEGMVSSTNQKNISFSVGAVLDSARINQDGQFRIEIPLDEPAYGIILFNRSMAEIYLEPGKELMLTIQSDRFPDEIQYDGTLGPVNHYLQLARKLEARSRLPAEKLFAMEPARFVRVTDSIRDLKLQLLKEYLMRYPGFDSTFVRAQQVDILYSWAARRLAYPANYLIYTKRLVTLPDTYHKDYLSRLDINLNDQLTGRPFREFLLDYLDFKEILYLEENPPVKDLWFPHSVARFRVIHKELTDSVVRDWALFEAMKEHLQNYGTTHIETFITDFRLTCRNPEYLKEIESQYANWEKLARGTPAPALPMITLEGKKTYLADFQGSLVYVNLWASWSDWSLQEYPYWESLREYFEPRGVVFLSLSMDFEKDRKKWEYLVKERGLTGIHCMQDPASSALQESYYVYEIPRYFLIDKAGKIISVHAPGPSEGMHQTLTALLKDDQAK